MYEIVKEKGTGYRIILGIIVCVFITAILKVAFYESPTTLNDDLIKASNEINSHTPILIDSTTRFDRVVVLQGDIFQYNFTLLTLDKSQIDTNVLKSSGRQSIIEQIKQNPKIAIFRDNNVIIESQYADKNGDYIATITIYPKEY